MIDSKLKDKLAKLYALATRGVDGEQVNAQRMLINLMERHNITLEAFSFETKIERKISYKNDMERNLITQLNFMLFNETAVDYYQKPKVVLLYLTQMDYILFMEHYAFYNPLMIEEYKRMRKNFMDAFFNKHELFSTTAHESAEDLNENDYKAISGLMRGFQDKSFQKMLPR